MKTLGPPVSLLLLSLLAPAAARADAGDVIRCESDDGRPHYCRVAIGGEARLLRQLSDNACIEGDSWGRKRGAVWVDRGCRAEFVVERGADRAGPGRRTLRCESAGGRSNLCAADTRRGVQLTRQLSRNACIRGRSWGWNDAGIWVTGGCRAEFRLVAPEGRDPPVVDADEPALRRLRCESEDGQDRLCPMDTRGGVRLLRQRSRTACIENRTWGYDRRGVWVAQGCRGDFETGLGVASGWGAGRAD